MLTFSEIQKFKKKLRDRWDPQIELCGVISPKKRVRQTKNLSDTPESTFLFDGKDLEGAIASWHSHPDGTANLSIADYRFFQSWPNQAHFIISSDEVRCYTVEKGLVYFIEQEKDLPSRASS